MSGEQAHRDRLGRRFRELFERYLADPDERHLAAASEIGRAMTADEMPVEEIAELYHETLQAIAKQRPQARFAELCPHLSMPLLELLLAYGLELRRHQEEREVTRQALQAYSERLEAMVDERTRTLRQREQELLRAERMAMLGRLARAVGHELRNPLGAVKNVGYLLRMALESPSEDVRAALEILESAVAAAVENTESLLRFAEPRTPQMQRVDLNALVHAALGKLSLPPDVELLQDLAPELPGVLGDPEQLEQALRNLLVNGVQALAEGGQLRVSTLCDATGDALVVVRDTGCGIAADRMGRLFEPLYTSKAKGLGLGLPLARLLVEANGGRVDVVSDEGVGSAFTIRLSSCRRPRPGTGG